MLQSLLRFVSIAMVLLQRDAIRLMRPPPAPGTALVLDIGSTVTRAGVAGERAPRFLGQHQEMGIDWIKKGMVQDFDAYESHLREIFQNQLEVNPMDHPILISEPPRTTAETRMQITEILFDQFNVAGLYLLARPMLALFAAGNETGLVVHCGDQTSYVVPIYDGYCLTHAMTPYAVSGNDVTSQLRLELMSRGKELPAINSLSLDERLREIKETACFVVPDFEKAQTTFYNEFKLPDGMIIDRETRFHPPEVLFNPAEFGWKNTDTLAATVMNCLMKCDPDVRTSLAANIILSGGSTEFPGFQERLRMDLMNVNEIMFSSSSIIMPLNGIYCSWEGGSMLAQTPTFQDLWIRRQEYEEYGSSIINVKCPK